MNKSQIQPALVGAAGGAILMMVVGFGGLNWHLGNTVDRMVAKASEDSMVAALAPICAARFAAAAEKDDTVTADLYEHWLEPI